MHSKAKPPTKAEKKRMERICEIGCLACRRGGPFVPTGYVANVHHLTKWGRRRGHRFTIALCRWHHQGQTNLSIRGATGLYGPSFYHDANGFRKEYGSDDALLAHQELLLQVFKEAAHGH